MFTIAKTDDTRRLVFGYATVDVDADGREVVNTNGVTFAADELEDAAYVYVRTVADAGAMHTGSPIGKLVESLFVTPEKLAAMGLAPDAAAMLPRACWWVGFRVSPDAFAKVKDGTYTMFSIQGSYGDSEPV